MALTDNLVSYWAMNGNANDSTGTNNGSATDVTFGAGPVTGEGGGTYNGSTSRIGIGNPASLQLNTLTMMAWFKTADAGASYRNILEKSLAYTMLLKDNVIGSYQWASPAGDKLSATDPTNDTWRLVFFRQNSGVGSGFTIYLDNSLIYTNTYTASAQTGGMSIGSEGNGGAGQNYAGQIGPCAIWSRLLTTDEMTELWNGGAGLAYPFTTTDVKTWDGIARANVKTLDGVASANIKTINGIT